MKFGSVKSCGCMQAEARIRTKTKHGKSHTRLFRIWSGMKGRCNRPTDEAYKDYGGRGIKVCAEWSKAETGFPNFYNWAINNGYAENLTIDRINPDGDYEPSNCRWTDRATQNRNRRFVKKYNIRGEILTRVEISKKYNLKCGTICAMERRGIDLEKFFKEDVTNVYNNNGKCACRTGSSAKENAAED